MPATKAEPARKRTIEPRELAIGDRVLWYAHGQISSQPSTALVVEVFNNTGRLLVQNRGSITPFSKDGVRHIDDPFVRDNKDAVLESGAWDWTERDKQIEARLAALEELMM